MEVVNHKEEVPFAHYQAQFQAANPAAIRERLGMTPTRFYQRLNHLLDREDALAHDPILVHRLRRIRTRHH